MVPGPILKIAELIAWVGAAVLAVNVLVVLIQWARP